MGRTENIEFTLKQFNISEIRNDSVVVIIGKRGSGKSFLIRDILYNKRDLPIGLVMSHTDHLVHFYDKFIPNMLIYKSFDSDRVTKLFSRQQKAIDENWKDPYAFLLLDDVLSDKAWKADTTIQEVFFNGRHYKLLFLLGIQSPMGIGPALRGQIDYTFIFKTNIESDKKRLYENYAGALKSQEIFNIVLDATTEDYNCLVINNKTSSNKMEDCVFYYKAKDHPDFRICSNDVWQKNEKRNTIASINKYNNKYNKTESSIKRGKGKITINKKLT